MAETQVTSSSSCGGTPQGQDSATMYCLKYHEYYKTGRPHFKDVACMPYASEPKQIGQGASGKVYTFKIMAGHLTETILNPEPVEKVRKEFHGSKAEVNFKAENDFLLELLGRGEQTHKNIMAPELSYAVGSPTRYNIVFEPAICSLSTYLSGPAHFPNGDAAERLRNVDRMIGVAGGLHWLSTSFELGPETQKYEETHSSHRDLRPENILVCKEKTLHPGHGELLFKISDFGRALTKIAPTGSTRGHPSSEQVEMGENIGGTYAAPEADRAKKSDVWSFGCVLLVVLTFNYEGFAGVNEFMASLRRESGVDRFYDAQSHKANIETANCMKYLEKRSEIESDKRVTSQLLGLLEERILLPEKRRADMEEVEKTMKKSYNQKDLVVPEAKRRSDPALRKGARHCAQSPKGEFEMFHQPGDTFGLVVYHNDLCAALGILEPISAPKLKEPKSWHRVYPRSDSCGTSTICQIISNREPIELLLYRVPEKPGAAVDREFICLTDIPHVSHVAVSPNSKFLAVDAIAGSRKSNFVLKLFATATLAEQMSKTHEVPTCGTIPEGISLSGVSGDYLDLLSEKASKRPIVLATEALRFSQDNRHLYHVTKSKSNQHKGNPDCLLEVAIWDVEARTLVDTQYLHKWDLDCKEFLTCFTPLNKNIGFIAITCRSFISRYQLERDEPATPHHPEDEEETADVLEAVVIAPDDSFAIFLGGNTKLSMHIAQQAHAWKRNQVVIEKADTFAFESGRDAASIMTDNNLLISYGDGRSVTFDLRVALSR